MVIEEKVGGCAGMSGSLLRGMPRPHYRPVSCPILDPPSFLLPPSSSSLPSISSWAPAMFQSTAGRRVLPEPGALGGRGEGLDAMPRVLDETKMVQSI